MKLDLKHCPIMQVIVPCSQLQPIVGLDCNFLPGQLTHLPMQ